MDEYTITEQHDRELSIWCQGLVIGAVIGIIFTAVTAVIILQ